MAPSFLIYTIIRARPLSATAVASADGYQFRCIVKGDNGKVYSSAAKLTVKQRSGWQQISGVWYYFDSSGARASSEWRGGYWLSSNGAWTYQAKGRWHSDGTGWWFGDSTGWYASNTWQKIDGEWYYFDASGYMKTGWIKSGSTWYYLGSAEERHRHTKGTK